jgi:hypothetical protein
VHAAFSLDYSIPTKYHSSLSELMNGAPWSDSYTIVPAPYLLALTCILLAILMTLVWTVPVYALALTKFLIRFKTWQQKCARYSKQHLRAGYGSFCSHPKKVRLRYAGDRDAKS